MREGAWSLTCRRLPVSHLDRKDLISKELEDKTRLLKRNILASLQTEEASRNRLGVEMSGTFSSQQQCDYYFVHFIFERWNAKKKKKTHFNTWGISPRIKRLTLSLETNKMQSVNLKCNTEQCDKLCFPADSPEELLP